VRYIELNNQITQREDGGTGFFKLEKDKEAVQEYLKEVEDRLVKFDTFEEKITYMVEADFYYKGLFVQYKMSEIKEIFKIAEDYAFEFQSFMAVSKFYQSYAVKSNDKKNYLERYHERVSIVALYLSAGNMKKARRYVRQFVNQNYQPATPTFQNAGKSRRGEMVSCFLLEMDDTLNSINFIESTSKQLSKIGGGVADNLSKVRGRGEPIKGIAGAAKGILPVMKLLEDSFAYADQMGQRKGSGAAYLNIFHWDIEEFIDCKRINADEKSRIQTLSTGLIISNVFFKLAQEGKDFYVFGPHSVRQEYGIHMDDMDMDLMYDKLLNNKNITKRKISTATEFLDRIAVTQIESGYPYLMFKSNANKYHPLKQIGDIKMSNLCTEIFQLQETSIIADYGGVDDIKRDINCNLGSLNAVNVLESSDMEEAVDVAMNVLSDVSDMSNIANAPSIRKANEELHSVGLGVMNLHGLFAKYGIPYESKEALDFVDAFFSALNFYSIKSSMNIAIDRGETFKDFDKSEYANGNYFKQYLANDYSAKTQKVQDLLTRFGFHVPSPYEWEELELAVKKNGLYNAYRLAVAPTQSIGYVQNATPSVMPVVDQIETREYADSKAFYPMPFLSPKTMFLYKSAYNMDQFKIIDVIARMQKHIDQGISCILYVQNDIPTNELAKMYTYAAKKGLKSLYYTRVKNAKGQEVDQEGCVACAV